MTDPVIKDTFKEIYRDDYKDSDNYYKVLFNNGRALQQRELNQMQTIIGENVSGVSNFVLRNGASSEGGQIDVNNEIQFIKLDTTTKSLPVNPTSIEREIFAEANTGIRIRIEKVEVSEGSDPATLYVSYIDNNGNVADDTPVTITPGYILTGETSGTILQSQSTNTVLNPAHGTGLLFTVNTGKFYIDGNFVFTGTQSIVLKKYDSLYDGVVGFVVNEDIVTVNEDQGLYDNSGVNLNLSAPGADRYRVRLTLIDEADISAGDYFIKLAVLQDGNLFRDYNAAPNKLGGISETIKLYRHEESGNYAIKNFLVDFETNVDDPNKIDTIVDAGTAYISGSRYNVRQPVSITADKPRSTELFQNLAVASTYGNYVIATTISGLPDINNLGEVELQTIDFGGGGGGGPIIIGTARIRSIEKFGEKYKIYLFDIKINEGKSFTNTFGLSNGDSDGDFTAQLDISLGENNIINTTLYDKNNNNLFFELPQNRPSNISDIILTTQKIFYDTSDSSGALAITADAGHVFDDTGSWISTRDDSAGEISPIIALSSGNTQADITGLPGSTACSFAAYQQKSIGAPRTKTLETGVIESGLTPVSGVVSLGKADIYALNSVIDDTTSIDITSRYIFDNGQRDNFYDIGKLTLKAGASAPAGNVTVNYDYFRHGTTGDFFCVNSYSGQVAYEDIPGHRQANGNIIQLRDVLDFRPRKNDSGTGFTGTNAHISKLPRNTDLINCDVSVYLGVKGRIVLNKSGYASVILGTAEQNPTYPEIPNEGVMEIAKFYWYPYLLNDEDMSVDFVDNRRYTMRDIGAIERRIDELEEVTSLTMLELETSSIDILDLNGINRFKSGITADDFTNHAFSDTTLPAYRASIDPVRNELRPQFHAIPIDLVFDSDNSSGVIRKNDSLMIDYDEVVWKSQSSASRAESVNPYAIKKLVGNIILSPTTDNWKDTTTLPKQIVKGDGSFDLSEVTTYSNWDFNWSGVTQSEIQNYKAGDTIGQKEVLGGQYTQKLSDGGTGTYRKSSTQQYYVSSISTVKESLGEVTRNMYSIPYMRSRFVSFKAEGLRPNTRYYPFFGGRDVSAWINASSGTAAFVPKGSLDRDSIYLNVGNKYEDSTEYPTELGGQTTIITDSTGSVSGWFLIPNTDNIRFSTGKKILRLVDINKFDINTALSYAEIDFEATGVMKEVQERILATRQMQVARKTTTNADELLSKTYPDPTPTNPSYPGNNGGVYSQDYGMSPGDTAGNGADNGGGGGDGGDGGTVLCTALYTMGELDSKVWALDARYGQKANPVTHKGYLLWAKYLAECLKERGFIYNIMSPTVHLWANHIAAIESDNKYGKRTIRGSLLRGIGEPVCWSIGKISTLFNKAENTPYNVEKDNK